jgi:hypothetical protein
MVDRAEMRLFFHNCRSNYYHKEREGWQFTSSTMLQY